MNTKGLISAIFASALLVSPSFAQDQALAPGKAAGVHKADLSTPTLLAIGVLTAIVVGTVLVVTNESDQKTSTPTNAATTTTTA